ncbi:hypothetical protein C8R45DRAFT_1095333 [Mycena sanguinolenta]|nr:hypothetical protein C8R45DRAFT_1095333 [Mycena sanguinolenta]
MKPGGIFPLSSFSQLPFTVSEPLRGASACIKPVSVCPRHSAQPPSKPFLALLNPRIE